MQKKLFRILSVFLAVVIISVGFMQPIAYANTIVVGGALVLLVAGLLIACGMVFTSQAQAESVANYAISSMPSDLLSSLAGFVDGGDPNQDKSMFSALKNGYWKLVGLPMTIYFAFRLWFNEHFGVNEETVASGEVAAPIASVESDDEFSFPIYTELQTSDLDFALKHSIQFSSFTLNNVTYVLESNGAPFYNSSSGKTLQAWGIYSYSDVYGRQLIASTNFDISHDINYYIMFSRISITGTLGIAVYHNRYENQSFVKSIPKDKELMPLVYVDSSMNIILNPDAYNNEIPDGQETVSIAIADDMSGKSYDSILGDYSLENWDYQSDLEVLKQMIESLVSDLADKDDFDALKNQAESLKGEIDKLAELVAGQGADAVGGKDALDDGMYDAGLVIDGIRDLIKDKDNTDIDGLKTKIKELEDAIDDAQDKIKELTKDKEIDVPTDPPIIEGAKGKINWGILMNLAIFKKFPFSIPFDVYAFFDALAAAPVEPVFVFDIFGGKFGADAVIVLDFKAFENIRKLVRTGVLIMLIVGLIAVTRKYIWK